MAQRTRTARYECLECGAESIKWLGRCPDCGAWGSIHERASAPVARVQAALVPTSSAARAITETPATQVGHRPTGIGELDRVLGGGIVPGAAILLSGEPGVGKSTLLLTLAAGIAAAGTRVLYLSAEESVAQVRLRAERIGALQPELFLASESDLASVLGQIEQSRPGLVILDSVQTVAAAEVSALPGQPSQVREVATALIRVAKQQELPVILVGHVTKDGQVAGPRLLEHLVDVVAHVEGDRQTALRFIRTLKNRFGPTDEVGCFEMGSEGMHEVADPSALFLSSRNSLVSGTCVAIALEGRRPLAVEVQALVVSSTSPNPRRVTSGVDGSRVAMLMAVLERRLQLRLSDKEVYVATVGGVRLQEPAADLAIALSIASAVRDEPLRPGVVAYGEVTLAGEIRAVTQQRIRAAEAARMGFSTVIDPQQSSLPSALERALLRASGSRRHASTPPATAPSSRG